MKNLIRSFGLIGVLVSSSCLYAPQKSDALKEIPYETWAEGNSDFSSDDEERKLQVPKEFLLEVVLVSL